MSSNAELKEWLQLYADRDIVDVTKPVTRASPATPL